MAALEADEGIKALAGLLVPLAPDRWRFDLAVFATTVTDVIGFLSFLRLASILLIDLANRGRRRPIGGMEGFAMRLKQTMAMLVCLAAMSVAAVAKDPVPGLSGGGSLPLDDVLAIAKPYPNLVLQVRLELVRANLKREQVVCTGSRFGNSWVELGGARLAPYQCKIGNRTLMISASQSYFDKNSRKLKPTDRDLMRKAATVRETGLTWRWK